MVSAYKKTALIFTVALVIIAMAILLFQQNYPVIVVEQPFEVITHADPKSTASLLECDSSVMKVTYTIGENSGYEYGGGGLLLENMIDIRGYHTLELEINSSASNDASIMLNDYIEGFSTRNVWLTHRYWNYSLTVEEGKDHYSIPLSELYTPAWWWHSSKIKKEDLPQGEGEKQRISGFHFCNHPNTLERIPQNFELKSIRFTRSFATIWQIALSAWGLLFLLTTLLQKSFFGPKSVIKYKHVVVNDETTSDSLNAILTFINESYTNPHLNLHLVKSATGFSEPRIRQALKDEIGKGINQYINELRVTEACRLLQESDLQIKEIAHRVGYSHISSFNRAFNRIVHENPQRFRLNKRKS